MADRPRRDRLGRLEQARLRVVFLVLGGLVLTLAILPLLLAGDPLLASAAGLVDRLLLSPVCHQLPARSPTLAGIPAGLCWRCLALLLGGIAGTLLAARASAWNRSRGAQVLLVTLTPLLVDVAAQHLGLYSSNTTRFLSGLAAGCGAALALFSSSLPLPLEGPP